MEWNSLLLWIAGLSCVLTLFRLLKSPTKQWGFIGASVVVLAVIGGMWLVRPDVAGLAGGAAWAVLILFPSMLYRRVLRAVSAMQFARAASLANFARLLHPMDGWWHLPQLYRANALADRGEDAAAAALFEPLKSKRPPIGITASMQACRLKHDWAGVIELAQSAARTHSLMRSSQIIPMYLRALGELGLADPMVGLYDTCRLTFGGDQFSAVRAGAQWSVLAFAGRTAALAELFDHSFRDLSPHRRQFWLARADWAAGKTESATTAMAFLARSPEPAIAIAATRVLENPPAPADLSPASHATLDQIEQDVRHDLAYAVAPHGYRSRPIITTTLIVANVIVFCFEMAMGGSENEATLMKLGAAETNAMLHGQWWRAITANFLHFGVAHILLNMLALRSLGPFVERFLGKVRYSIVYAVTGVGAVGGVVWMQYMGWLEPGFLVGASGAIMGLIGATGAILLRGWLREGALVAKRRLRLIAFIVVLQVVFDNLTPQVSGSAHLIGLASGFLVTLLLMIGMRNGTSVARGFSPSSATATQQAD